MFSKFLINIIIVLFIFLLSYALGRRVGKKEGYKEGIKSAPLILRKNYQKTGKCPICGQNLNKN